MWTKRGKYGLKALLYLADQPAGKGRQIHDIAEQNTIPHKYCEAILVDLKNGRLLVSRKGKGGGYSLARPASEILVGEAVRLLDGPLAPLPCASKTRYRRCSDCPEEHACVVRLIGIDVRDAIIAVLDHTTLADMRAQSLSHRHVLSFDI